jgi:hypothetical protein
MGQKNVRVHDMALSTGPEPRLPGDVRIVRKAPRTVPRVQW